LRVLLAPALAALTFALASPAGHAQSPPPETDALDCRILRVEAESYGFARVTVEVRNDADRAIEPLVFRFTLPRPSRGADRPTRDIARCRLPHVARRGRPVPPHGQETYWLQIGAYDAKELEKRGALDVEVVTAVTVAGDPLPEPPLEIGPIEATQAPTFQGGDVPASTLSVRNPLDVTVDVIVRGRFSQPRDLDAYFGMRLPPGATTGFLVSELPADLTFELTEFAHKPTKLEAIDVVDWCAVETPDAGAVGELVADAYRAWVRWPEPRPSIAGRFALASTAMNGDKTIESRVEGRFRLGRNGDVHVDVAEAKKARAIEQRIRRAFAEVLRPGLDELLADNRIELVTPDTVAIDGRGFFGDRPSAPEHAPCYTIADGRIRSDGQRASLGHTTWRTLPLAGGWVVARRSVPNDQWSEQFSWTVLEGLPMPMSHQSTLLMPGSGELMSDHLLTFSDLQIVQDEGAEIRPAPSGPGVELLRSAWQRVYRYPERGLAVEARIAVKTPGTDLVWGGVDDVDGSIAFTTRRGLSDVDSLRFTPSRAATPRLRTVWSGAIHDRFVMWAGRDFNARRDFDDVFRGASIGTPDDRGVARIEGGPWREALIEDGLVTACRLTDGRLRRIGYTKVGDDLVATEVETEARPGERGERLTARYSVAHAADGTRWLLPTHLRFERVFGDDWGPETIALRRVEGQPATDEAGAR
jgi:hypothetical protein